MKKKRVGKFFIIFCIILSLFGCVFAASEGETPSVNFFEQVICELLLKIGDFVVWLIGVVVGENVTVSSIVYNQVDAFNPNFFDKQVVATGITKDVTAAVSDWYNVFKLLALAFYIVGLLAISIHILLASTADGMSKAKELLGKWVKALIMLIFMPYVIKYAFLLNEALVGMLRDSTDTPKYKIGSSFSAGEWSVEEIEFRSPEYVSRFTGSIALGSDEVNDYYLSKLQDYQQNLDLMRVMRVYAGITWKFIYAIIFWILIGQLFSFIFMYYKRYFMIAFFIATYPIVCIFHAISLSRGEPGSEITSWVKEILTNIFIQTVHAIIYTVISGMCAQIVMVQIESASGLNWILMILAINFVSDGEKIIRKIVGALGSSVDGAGKAGGQLKGAAGKMRGMVGTAMGGLGGGPKPH